jgi:hypothetical protein
MEYGGTCPITGLICDFSFLQFEDEEMVKPLKNSVKRATFSAKEIKEIDRWILNQKNKISRPQAIRHLVKMALAISKVTDQMEKNDRAPLVAELTALKLNLIQNPRGVSTPKVERLTLKRA